MSQGDYKVFNKKDLLTEDGIKLKNNIELIESFKEVYFDKILDPWP